MPPMQLPDDFAGGDIQRGEQRRGAMAFVVVGSPLGDARRQRQQRLRAVQRLNLTLLVDAQHHGLGRRIQYSPTISRTFSTNSGSVESLKVSCRCGCRPNVRQMRADRRLRQAGFAAPSFACSSASPRLGAALQRLGNHRIHSSIIDRARRAGRGASSNPSSRCSHESIAPLRTRSAACTAVASPHPGSAHHRRNRARSAIAVPVLAPSYVGASTLPVVHAPLRSRSAAPLVCPPSLPRCLNDTNLRPQGSEMIQRITNSVH